MKTFRTLCAAAAIAAATATAAPALAKETPPAASAPRPYKLPARTDFTLGNGIPVTLVPFGNVPKTTILVALQTGDRDEGADTWLADMTTAMMLKGAGGKNASQLAEAAAAMGGSLGLGSGGDSASARIDVLSESVPQAVALLADLLRRPDFPAAELDKVRADQLRNLSVAKSTPQSIAAEAYAKLVYPEHPYGISFPTEAQVKGYTIDQVKAFHAANFGASRARIYVVGRYDEAQVRNALAASFGDWAAGTTAVERPAKTAGKADVVLIDRPGAPQSTIKLGLRADPPKDDIRLDAVDTLLGGYFSSRITRNIREDKGYTYSPYSQFAEGRFGADWSQSADVTAESTGASLTEVYKEIARMRSEPPSAAEVQGIRNYLTGTFALGLASRGAVASRLASLNVLGLPPSYLDSYVGKVSALTAADFQNAAQQYLDPAKMTVVVVGPLDSVRPQLAKVAEISSRLPK